MKEFIKKNKFNICVMFIYSIVTLIAVIFHENWRDEAQSWLIARDLSFIDIFKQMRYEGHPCLWHFILAPFAKLGLPYVTENIISFLIMNITAFLILNKCPLNKFLKVLILFSAPFIYYYPVISRSYCLIPLALALIAITYKTRKEKPIRYVLSITLLAHTHVLMLGVVGILYLFFFVEELILKFNKKNKQEKKAIIISLLIAIIGLLLLFVQLYSSIDTNSYVEENFELDENKLDLLFIIIYTIFARILGNTNLIFNIIVFFITLVVLIYQFILNKKITSMMLVSICFQLFVYLFIYSDLVNQKSLTMLLIIIFFAWIEQYEDIDNTKKKLPVFEIYLCFILAFSCIFGVRSVSREIKYKYSYAKETAGFINNNISEDAIFIPSDIPFSSAIIPFTNVKKFWSPQINDYFSFVTWNEETASSYYINDFKNVIDEKFNDKNNIYFIYCYNWTEEGLQWFIDGTSAEELFRTEAESIQKDEKYILYKLYNN